MSERLVRDDPATPSPCRSPARRKGHKSDRQIIAEAVANDRRRLGLHLDAARLELAAWQAFARGQWDDWGLFLRASERARQELKANR